MSAEEVDLYSIYKTPIKVKYFVTFMGVLYIFMTSVNICVIVCTERYCSELNLIKMKNLTVSISTYDSIVKPILSIVGSVWAMVCILGLIIPNSVTSFLYSHLNQVIFFILFVFVTLLPVWVSLFIKVDVNKN